MSQAEGRLVGGRYHLVEQIGRGGMGVVWRAHDQLLDREVAVKEVRFDSAMGDELSDLNRRTMREARAAGRLTHPNVVVVHDVIEEDDRPWIVMQLVPSRSLGQVIREDGPLTPERTAEIGLQVLDALRAAHRQGVLHRDVKPENVLLAEDGRVVLTDFGIARIEADSTMTRTGLVGTPAFIPPERLRGSPAQRESDLWSLGATLYAAVEGRPPHDKGMAMATMHAVLNDDPAPSKRAGRLGPVLTGLLAKEPEDRPGYDEITRLLRQAARPASPAAPPGEAARAGARPYGSAAKPARAAEDDRGDATRKAPGRSPSRPVSGAAAGSSPGKGAAAKPAEPRPTEAQQPEPRPAEAHRAEPRPDRGALDDAEAAGPGEITSPLPAIGADGRPVTDAGTDEAGAAGADDDATGGKVPGGGASAEASGGTAAKTPGKTSGKGSGKATAQRPGEAAAGADRADRPRKPEQLQKPEQFQKPGKARRPGKTGDDAPADASSSGAKKDRPAAVLPIPETGAQAAPPVAKVVPKPASTPSAPAHNDPAEDPVRDDSTGAARDQAPAEPAPAEPAADRLGPLGPLGQLTPAADPDGLAVPTQRSVMWQGGVDGRPAERRRMPVVKVALVLVPVLMVIAGVAGYLGLREGERSSGQTEAAVSSHAEAPAKGKESPAPAASELAVPGASPSAESTSSPSPSPTTSQPADVPKGWYRYKDKTGFSVALPKGWKVSSRRDTRVWFRGPGTSGFLLIDQTSSPRKDAEKDWRDYEPSAKHGFPGYKLIKIKSIDYWKSAADWEFTWDTSSGKAHVLNRGFVTDKHHGYAIYWHTLDDRWEKDYHYFETFTATFEPAK
ncbi:serine/threonine-protein kinase [Sphaerimonospora mesophila]|uniref:serine/threonine-protein kinase n=1 Tax=Sphaerimonospora mesophila TaxID=37483 RepID=UPI0009F8B4CD